MRVISVWVVERGSQIGDLYLRSPRSARDALSVFEGRTHRGRIQRIDIDHDRPGHRGERGGHISSEIVVGYHPARLRVLAAVLVDHRP